MKLLNFVRVLAKVDDSLVWTTRWWLTLSCGHTYLYLPLSIHFKTSTRVVQEQVGHPPCLQQQDLATDHFSYRHILCVSIRNCFQALCIIMQQCLLAYGRPTILNDLDCAPVNQQPHNCGSDYGLLTPNIHSSWSSLPPVRRKAHKRQAIFCMSFFNYSPVLDKKATGWSVSSEFWVYWVFAIPLSIYLDDARRNPRQTV